MVAAVSAASLVPVVLAGPGRAATDPGQGTAIATTDRIDPRAGSLSIGITFGTALAGHQNRVAKAQSQAVDLGAIGTSLAAYQCDGTPGPVPDSSQPQPLTTETGQAGADKGISQSDLGGSYSRFVRADSTPAGEAVTTTAPLSLAGVVSVGGGVARAWSGITNGVRQATATVDMSGITFPGGTSLAGLHWEATFQSIPKVVTTGRFSIGHATIGGVAVPTTDPTATLAKLNTALLPLGLRVDAPSSHVTSGIQWVEPLGISVVPSATRDNLAGVVLGAVQPIRQQAFDALLKAYCKAETEITVVDVAVGGITGAGSFNLTIGGVQATSGVLPANGFDLGIPGSALGSFVENGALPSTGLGGESPGFSAPTSAALPATAPAKTAPAGVVASGLKAVQGARGGALAGVSLGALAVLAALAEADRRKMRRAQRLGATFEE